jgi:hypothetical protein
MDGTSMKIRSIHKPNFVSWNNAIQQWTTSDDNKGCDYVIVKSVNGGPLTLKAVRERAIELLPRWIDMA